MVCVCVCACNVFTRERHSEGVKDIEIDREREREKWDWEIREGWERLKDGGIEKKCIREIECFCDGLLVERERGERERERVISEIEVKWESKCYEYFDYDV